MILNASPRQFLSWILLAFFFTTDLQAALPRNGDFEAGLENWSTKRAPGIAEALPEAAQESSTGLRLAQKKDQPGGEVVGRRFGVEAGDNYVVTLQYRLREGGPLRVYLRFMGEDKAPLQRDGRVLQVRADATETGEQWQEMRLEGVAPAEAHSATIILATPKEGPFLADVDNVSVVGQPIVHGAGSNLLANSGFEEGETAWSLWIPQDEDEKNPRWSVTTEGVHGGKAAAEMAADVQARYALQSEELKVVPGQKYKLSAWVRAEPRADGHRKTPGVMVRLLFLDVTGRGLDEESLYVTRDGTAIGQKELSEFANRDLPKDWVQIEEEFTVPGNASSLRVQLFSWVMGGKLYWDDLQLTPLD